MHMCELDSNMLQIKSTGVHIRIYMLFSLCTTLCLQWESPAIAIAFLYLAARLSKYDLQAQAPCKTKSWWRQFLDTVDVHDLEGM